MLKATIFDIERNSFVDGPGIRTTVFFKGCNLKCAWCHNPESQSSRREMLVYKNKCTGCGKCLEACPNRLVSCDFCGKCELYCPNDARKICGREYTTDEVLREVIKDKVFYAGSGGGVTFSGGECMLQIDFLAEILKKCKAEGIHTAVDTAGCIDYAHFEKILPYTDMLLYDFKCFNSDKHLELTGVRNELILENLKKLLRTDAEIWIRIPVIVGVNDSPEEMQQIKNFFAENGRPKKIELLPYHAMGEHKYEALGKRAQSFSPPDKAKLEALNAIFSDLI